MASDGSMIMLAVVATVVVLYIVKREKKENKATPLASRKLGKPRASLGDCTNVDIDSPDFARCSLGSGRSVIRSKPRADNIDRSFRKDNYKLGNPFAVKVNDSFKTDTDRKLGSGKAFPFSKSGALPKGTMSHMPKSTNKKVLGNVGQPRGQKFNPRQHQTRKYSKASTTRGPGRAVEDVQNGMEFLGAAVSPSSASLGATAEEIAQSTNKLDNINNVASNTGGNLNLLHPL